MKTQRRRVSLGFEGVAFLVLAVLGAANCSSKGNPAPGNTGGTGGHATGGTGGVSATGGTSGSGGAGGVAATGGTGGTTTDGGAGNGGDGSACDASGLAQDAGCMACAMDPLNSCSPVPTTCIPFDNSKIPTNIPRL